VTDATGKEVVEEASPDLLVLGDESLRRPDFLICPI
jgi:hypothetical protein